MDIQKYIDEAYKKGVEDAQAEIESLRSKLEIANAEVEYLNRLFADERSGIQDESFNKRLRWEIESLLQKLTVAEEALGFYANKKYYEDNHPHALASFHEDCCTIKNDYGYNAREALAKIRGEG